MIWSNITLLAVMKPKGKITALAQYIIDSFRILYFEKGITGRKFSSDITEGSNPTRVAGFENIYNNETYTPELIKKGLNYFDMTMDELLPDELLDNDKLIEKTRIPILPKMSIKAALSSLIAEGYFDTPRLRSEITKYYNSFIPKDDHKINSDISASLESLYNEGKLLKQNAVNSDKKRTGLIQFIRNMDFKED